MAEDPRRLPEAEVTVPAHPLPRQSSLGYQVNHLARLLALALRERIEAFGVAPGQFAQLLTLYESDGLTQAELCERVRIEQPTMASTLARMERDGLVKRVPDTTDRRRSLVMLTPRAREIEGDLVAAARAVNAMACQGLDDQTVGTVMASLSTMITNLEGARDTG
jgi:DNA-binding MarR family transcriptional regulator